MVIFLEKRTIDIKEISRVINTWRASFFYRTDNLLVLQWKGNRNVPMLSTLHEPMGKVDFVTKQQRIKLFCVKEYNKNRRLVDKYDMQISFSECIRRSAK